MFFSQRVSLESFVYDLYDVNKNYRLTFDSQDNSCIYIDYEFVHVPDFRNVAHIAIDDFYDMMTNKTFKWDKKSRFCSLYLYVQDEKVYPYDKDNCPIHNLRDEYEQASLRPKRKSNKIYV